MNFEIKAGCERPEEIKEIFNEYTSMLVESDPSFAAYLDIQKYDDEIEHPEKKYAQPDGLLLRAYSDGKLAGCIAYRRIDSENCEMKRLYVRPAFRGQKIASILLEMLIDAAKFYGYRYMLLDTLPFLRIAIGMYRKAGFYEIQSYNNSPMKTSIFMKLDLQKERETT